MLAKVINIKKSGVVSAKAVLAYLGRDQPDQAAELAQFGPPQMGLINDDGSINSLEDRLETAEHMDLITERSNSKTNPLYHVAINWQEGEHPNAKQAKEACEHVMKSLGFEDCLAVWALHQDTDNDHVHLVIHRIPAESPSKAIAVPAWDYLTLDKAMREIEVKQGWAHSNGPWIALEIDGKPEIVRMSRSERRSRGLLQDADGVKLTQAAIHAEINTSDESFQRWVSKEPAAALKKTLDHEPTWQKVHEALAAHGLEIAPKGSGMVVTTTLANGKVMAAKASQLGRFATKANLEKVLGSYVPPDANTKFDHGHYEASVAPKTLPKEITSDQRLIRRKERGEAREVMLKRYELEQAAIKKERVQLRQALKLSHTQERNELSTLNKAERAAVREKAKKTNTNVTVALSLWAFEAAKKKEVMQLRHASERKALNPQISRTQVFRAWLETQAGAGDEAAQAALRGIKYREQREKAKRLAAIEGEEIANDFKKMSMAGLAAEIDKKRQRVVYSGLDGSKKFTDTGPRIEMHDKAAPSLEAALRLAAQKYGGKIELTGSAQFRERAAQAATRLGIKVVDRDLQDVVQRERQLMNQKTFAKPITKGRTGQGREA